MNVLKIAALLFLLGPGLLGQAPPTAYFGQKPPGLTAEMFAPGRVSTGLEESIITFTPDGLECYWSLSLAEFETILTRRWENGAWTKPEVAPFAGKYYDGWPALRPDGRRLFFHSTRPRAGGGAAPTPAYNIWYMDRVGRGWGEPVFVEGPVNEGDIATCPSVTRDGTIYFSKRLPGDTEKLCRSRLVDGRYGPVEVLPDVINPGKDNFHGVIAPDESLMVRSLYGRKDAVGAGWNYYVSFRGPDDRWSEWVNLGPAVNTLHSTVGCSFSPDGKYFFFKACQDLEVTKVLDRRHALAELLERDRARPGNSGSDIYWIDAAIIESVRPGKAS